MTETRKLAAILVTDIVGYSRLAGADEDRILARLRTLRSDLIDPTIAVHHGRIVKRTGDGSVIEFRSIVDAVNCAIEIQRAMVERNAEVAPDRRIEFRVGIHLGDVVEENDGDLMGDGVNVAARLEGICEPGGVCLSEDAYRQVKSRLELQVADLGPQSLKNIAEPVHAYLLRQGAPATQKSPKAATRTRDVLHRWPAFAAALALVLLAAGTFAWRAGYAPRFMAASVDDKLANAPRFSIVVLPFENLSGDKEQDYFADAVTEDLTTDLSHLHDSFVISRNTAFTYKGKPVDPKAIGKELGVRYVLEGSARRLGEMVEINAQLISTETGAHVWADRFEDDRSNLGLLQFEVVGRLARSLDLELTRAESFRAVRERPSNPDAVDLRMRGEAMVRTPNAGKSTWDEAQKLFERAHALDPQDARATWLVALVLATRAQSRWSDDSPAGATFLSSVVGGATPGEAADIARAEQLVDAADALQPDEAWVHYTKGFIHHIKQQWVPALTEMEIAIADDRNNPWPYAWVGLFKSYLGRSAEGVPDIETALRLSPHDFGAPLWEGWLCSLKAHLTQWEQAIEACEKAAAGVPETSSSHTYVLGRLAAAYAWTGRDKEAKATIAQLRKVDPNYLLHFQSLAESHDNPTFKAEMARVMEGMRKAEALEGEAKSN
jgi:class 3 adenylate cyclase/TolB-like protein